MSDARSDARSILEALIGRQIETARGHSNTVLGLQGDDVVVATDRSPAGQLVPISYVQDRLDELARDGEVVLEPRSLNHRSSFVGAVLSQLPGTYVEPTSPPRIRLGSPIEGYRSAAAGNINSWWANDADERFWLEITDRPDIGVDLHCPQRDSAGKRSAGFSLIWCVRPGDVVFHYDLNAHAIVAWSNAVGDVTEAPTVWLSHRGQTRRRLHAAFAQPGWWLDLQGPFALERPLTLTDLRARADEIRSVLDSLRTRVSGSIYFPFFFWGGTELRPMQPYLNKLPKDLLAVLPVLGTAVPGTSAKPGLSMAGLGADYREARPAVFPDGRQPFSVDPTIIERGLRGHADTQNALATALRTAGLEPRSPAPAEPNFDLAWFSEETVFVAEVKSITRRNEEEQLRLGLGQVLRYRQTLTSLGHPNVTAVLVPERSPQDGSWRDLCAELGVILLSGDEVNAVRELRRS
jgi:hypothetical protein